MPADVSFKASFRILGPGFNPESIKFQLSGVSEQRTLSKSGGSWAVLSDEDMGADLNLHLARLIAILEPYVGDIKRVLEDDCRAEFFVSVFAEYPANAYASARIYLSPQIIERIGFFGVGVGLVFDVYAENDLDED